jgi:hypothetical protein
MKRKEIQTERKDTKQQIEGRVPEIENFLTRNSRLHVVLAGTEQQQRKEGEGGERYRKTK